MELKKLKNPSIEELDEPATDSVYDFLYYDASRIASFLSQFDPSGHLTEVTQGDHTHRKQQINTTVAAEGSVAIFKGSRTSETDVGQEYGKESQRIYDPRWANALVFLDYLDDSNLLHRNVETARIGQIVLFSGDLALFDLGMLRRMWDLPIVKKNINFWANAAQPEIRNHSNRHERRNNGMPAKSQKAAPPSDSELALELMTVLPHAIQAAVSSGEISVWSSLREDSVTVAPSDLFLKHGLTIEGTWNMVGILDAFPDNDDHAHPEGALLNSALKQFSAGSKLGHFASSIAPQFAPAIRQLLGRPTTSYGFTPLLLFREISG